MTGRAEFYDENIQRMIFQHGSRTWKTYELSYIRDFSFSKSRQIEYRRKVSTTTVKDESSRSRTNIENEDCVKSEYSQDT